MSALTFLEPTLNEILHVINPLREDWETRTRIIDELRGVVSTIESLRGATVEPFGSFLSQLYTRWGDLDISVELSNGTYISTASKRHKQTLLAELLKALRRTGGFRRLQSVLHARVPILKLESNHQNISCDISINNLSGQMKSKFLLWISLIDQRFRDMVLLVKEWAKANDINNPKTGTLNSYSLSLLVIFHFQTCVPAILPPLRDIYSENVADELIGVRADVEGHIEEISVANIAKFRKERRINNSSLPELFVSFFGKFSNISTRSAHQGICTYTGKWEDISTNTTWLPRTFAIFVEDPFEQPQNTARAVNSSQLTRIGEAFTNTYLKLTTQNQTRNSLIPSLVRYEISRFFPGVTFRNGDANGGAYLRTNQSTYNYNNHVSFQPQFQKTRQVSHSDYNHNMSNQKPVRPKRRPGNRPNVVREGATGPTRPATHGQDHAQQTKPQLSHALLPSQVNNVASQRSVKAPKVQQQATHGQDHAQQTKPQLSHALLPSQANNVASQRSIKAPQVQQQAQQVWRPKQ